MGMRCDNLMCIQFKKYTDDQILTIIESKLNKISSVSNAEQQCYHPSDQEEKQRFMDILQCILPKLKATSGHVQDMMNVALQVWELTRKKSEEPNSSIQKLLDAKTKPGMNTLHKRYISIAQNVMKLPFVKVRDPGTEDNLAEPEVTLEIESCEITD